MDRPKEEEWEYEYEETETEDFYVTLDLSQLPDRGDSSNPTYYNPRSTGGRRPVASHKRIREHDYVHPIRTGTAEPEDAVNEQEFAAFGEIQISGLNTVHPLANYNGELISLKWASTLGTDLLFTKSNPNVEPQYTPLRSLDSANLVGISSAKLTANVVSIYPKESTLNTNAPAVPDVATAQASATGSNETGKRRPDKAGFHALLKSAKAKRHEKSGAVGNQGERPVLSASKDTSPTASNGIDQHREFVFFSNDSSHVELHGNSHRPGSLESNTYITGNGHTNDGAQQSRNQEHMASVAPDAAGTDKRRDDQDLGVDVIMEDAPE